MISSSSIARSVQAHLRAFHCVSVRFTALHCIALRCVHCVVLTALCSLGCLFSLRCVHCIVFIALLSLRCVHCVVLIALCSFRCVHCAVFTALYSLRCGHCVVFTALPLRCASVPCVYTARTKQHLRGWRGGLHRGVSCRQSGEASEALGAREVRPGLGRRRRGRAKGGEGISAGT